MRWLSRLISTVVIIAALALMLVVIRSRMPATHVGQSFQTWALFRDGSRLAIGGPVMIAGVRVGEISDLAIVNGFARIDMRLRDDTDIPIDSWVTKRAVSAFGDSYIEIIPTTPEPGAATARKLRSGEQLTHVLEGASTDSALRELAKTMPKIDKGLDAVHDVALEGRKYVNGSIEEQINGADRWLSAGKLEQPIASADHAMERLETGTTNAAKAVADAGPGMTKTFDRIDNAIVSARRKMADVKTGLHDALADTRDGIDRIDPTIEQMTEVMRAIDEGPQAGQPDDWKGTLGKLVNSPELADSIEDATDTLAAGTASLNKFQAILGFRFEVNVFSRVPRAYATAEVRARNDKFYVIEFERGPLGNVPRDQLTDVPGGPDYLRYQQINEGNRFTAQIGKTLWGRVRVRGGVKESTFGFGADVLLGSGRLRLSADAFGSFQPTPRLKLAGSFEVLRHVFIVAGVDDALNTPGTLPVLSGNTDVPTNLANVRYGRDYFVGGALQFTDADLATLLRVYGALIVGLL